MINNFSKISFYFIFSLTVLSFFYYLASIWSSCPTCFGITNSDLTFIPALTHNLIYEKGHFSNWHFSATPFLFPDFVISLFFSLITKNIILNIALSGLLQITFFIIIISLLLTLITNHKINLITILALIFSTFLLSNEVSKLRINELFSAMFQSACHFGGYLMILISLYFFLKICMGTRVKLYVSLFFFTSIISIVSDVIFVFYLLMPLVLTIILCRLLKYFSKKSFIHLLLLLTVTGFSGYLLYNHLPIHYLRAHTFFHYSSINFLAFMDVMSNFFMKDPLIFILFISFLLFAPLSLITSYKDNTILANKWVNFIIFWIIVMIISTVPAFILTDQNLTDFQQSHYLGLRHLQGLILTPVFLGLPLLLYKHTNINELFLKKTFAANILLLICIASFNRPPLKIANFFSYYPTEIACFDDYVKKMNLHAGLANYWDSRPFTLFNRSNTYLAAVKNNLKPFSFLGTTEYYKKNEFDFMIYKSGYNVFDKEYLAKQIGKPSATFSCPGGYEFNVYKNNEMKALFKKHI